VTRNHWKTLVQALLCLPLSLSPALAATGNCYKKLQLPTPDLKPTAHILNIFIDQTTALSPEMKENVARLVSDWGDAGEQVRIARFSALVKGQFTELMFDQRADTFPDQKYLYNLRDRDRQQLETCLKATQEQFHETFNQVLRKTLDMTNPKLPKSDIFYSLKRLSESFLHRDDAARQSVLLVTDGMENSDYAAFHRGQPERTMNSRKLMAQLKKHDLEPDWQQANIYVFGLGYLPGKTYVRPRLLEPLKSFWSDYFKHSNGNVVQLGTPAILAVSLKNPG